MGCNCGKNRIRPSGTTTKKSGGAKTGSKGYALETPSGKTMTFGSRLEASAARVRSGGGRIIPLK